MDEFTDLYYDPSPLREHEKETKTISEGGEKTDRPSMPPPDHMATDSPSLRRTHSNAAGPSNPMPFSPRHPGPYPPQGMAYNSMGRIPPGQFYGNGDHGVPSPIRMGSMGMPGPIGDMGGMGGMTGLPMGNMGGMGGMGPMGMGGSPDPRRGTMRRGMSMGEDGFGPMGGMH